MEISVKQIFLILLLIIITKEKIQFDINQEFAKRLAKNLYNYLDSFNQNQDQSKQLLVVPLNSLENWYTKFLNKYKIDPNFLMKSDS